MSNLDEPICNRRLLILHFNDVYQVDQGGDAERFATKVKSYSDEDPLLLFSGDCFNPSLLSTVTKGKQMVEVLNALQVQCSCLGNHDLDFGVPNFETLASLCKFPWLISNITDRSTGKPLGGIQRTHLLEWKGIKIGLLGLAEEDWITTLATVQPETVSYTDFVTAGTQLASQLRDQGAELVIALTHMRRPNDVRCATETRGIDLVLGGHDHDYSLDVVQQPGGPQVHVVKSGTDFRTLSRIEIDLPGSSQGETGPHDASAAAPQIRVERLDVERSTRSDPVVASIAAGYADVMSSRMTKVVGETATELDGRFATVRLRESNLGNWVADIWRTAARADIVLLNSGTLRSDCVHPVGQLTMKDLLAILPMLDKTVVVQAKGSTVLAALENGVSQYPKLEGRFLQVSGVKFKFDPKKPPGHRIEAKNVWIAREEVCEPLDLSKSYAVATKHYLTSGKDGFECLKDQRVLVDDDTGPLLPTLASNVFTELDILNHFNLADQRARRAVAKLRHRHGKQQANVSGERVSHVSMQHPEHGRYVIAPACDGRIVCLAT